VTPRVRALLLPAATLLFILAGLAAYASPFAFLPRWIWLAGLVLTGLPVLVRTSLGALRGRLAADLVAALAIATALILDQPLPGLIVVMMQTGGEAMERFAERRATEAVRALEAAAPRIAHRLRPGGTDDIAVERIAVGDRLLVRPGEMIPCDGIVVEGHSHVDASRLTGEPVPVVAQPGTRLMSGSLNGEGPFTLESTAPASESQYARIVALVREAQASKSPLQRVADRYAVWFTPATLAVCALAWLASGDPNRILAVLVVATPCPLILATPVAVIGGISRAAARSVIFRHGEAIEQLGQADVALFDKTGTLTIGHPAVARILVEPPLTRRDFLRLTAAVEQGSGHLLARTVVEAADAEGIELPVATEIRDQHGQGVSGMVEGKRVTIGALAWVGEVAPGASRQLAALHDGHHGLRAAVAIDGEAGGVIEFADRVRPDLRPFFADLHQLGIRRTMLLTGDREATAQAVAAEAGITEVYANLLPADKVAIVASLVDDGHRVVMVGDGTNDAPALSRATVGVALAAHGGGISAEAADVVVLADDLHRVTEAIKISRRTLRIARQSINVGLGLSLVAMGFAALGAIPPIAGALLQEAIDVAVILNALRASMPAGR
jgi:heavy metal translocating P-type ATPase